MSAKNELKEELETEKANAAKAEQALEEAKKKNIADLDRVSKKFSEERATLKAEIDKLQESLRQER